VIVAVIPRRTAVATAETACDPSAYAFQHTPYDGECEDAAEDDAYDYGPFAASGGQLGCVVLKGVSYFPLTSMLLTCSYPMTRASLICRRLSCCPCLNNSPSMVYVVEFGAPAVPNSCYCTVATSSSSARTILLLPKIAMPSSPALRCPMPRGYLERG
jgi:hypothetical protein